MAFLPALRKDLKPAPSLDSHIVPYFVPPGQTGKPYRPPWDVGRAVEQAYNASIWVYRGINVIAENQARLPFVMRKGNPVTGNEIEHQYLDCFNFKSSTYEQATILRQRISHALYVSQQGAFVEVVKSRGGDLLALYLLPIGYTWPIPNQQTFVSAYRVQFPGMAWFDIPAENVIWIRKPHPTDPYLGSTPLIPASMDIEIDYFARQYNRNFLMNDGRPGGLLIVNGGMDEIVAAQLRNRFNGPTGWGVSGAGRITVMEGEDAQYVDTAQTARDAQYSEGRQQTKEAILAALGVPESMVGNASERCLRQTELVRLANGERYQAKDLVGKRFTLLTSSEKGQIEVDATASWESTAEIYRVTTESGRCLEVNGRHPLFAATYTTTKAAHWRSSNGPRIDVRQWTPVAELTAGDLVAVPTEFVQSHETQNDLSVAEAAMLGYMIGDGSVSQDRGHVALSSPDGPMIDDFKEIATSLGDIVVKYETPDRCDLWGLRVPNAGHTRDKWGHCNSATCKEREATNARTRRLGLPNAKVGRPQNQSGTRALLRRLGVLGCTAHTKFVPQEVFGASRAAQAAFLSRLYATDGCASSPLFEPHGRGARKITYGSVSIEFCTVSHRLALDVQELLLRFGVPSRISEKWSRAGIPALNGKRYHSYSVVINAAEDVIQFCDAIGIVSKEPAVDAAKQFAKEQLGRNKTHTWRTKNLDPGLRWERVKSIEPLGQDRTVGISVPGYHTYLSTFWEHNTYANAQAERVFFWRETMLSHLEIIARAFDGLTPEPDFFFGFDLTNVEELQAALRDARTEELAEVTGGVRMRDEYRVKRGLDPLGGGAAQLWAPSNLAPITGTDADGNAQGGTPGQVQGMPLAVSGKPGLPGMPPEQPKPSILGPDGKPMPPGMNPPPGTSVTQGPTPPPMPVVDQMPATPKPKKKPPIRSSDEPGTPNTWDPSIDEAAWDSPGYQTKEAQKEVGTDGIMVCIYPPADVAQRLAVKDGLPASSLHVTLAYLGKADRYSQPELQLMARIVEAVTKDAKPFEAEITGSGQFTPSDGSDGKVPHIGIVSSDGLKELRSRLKSALEHAGLLEAA